MEFVVDFIENNLYLVIAIVSFLVILTVILTIVLINKKKRNNIKKEFDEVVKIEEENEKTEDVKPEVAFELEQIFKKMQEDIELKPEEVVKKFEDEQEQKAIISYQELVDSVNNNKIEVVEEDTGDIDFVAALEEQMATTDQYISLIKAKTEEVIKEEKDDTVSKSHLDIIDVMNMDDDSHKFQTSEILSPVFGRMQPDFEYKIIDSHAISNNKVELEQVAGPTPQDDLAANEDFLRSLIEFRKKLE